MDSRKIEREKKSERERRKKDDGSSLIFLTYNTVNISLLQNNSNILLKITNIT